jgi:dihydrofolate reductase
MGKVTFEQSVSLDGYSAGPNPSLEDPLGEGGEQLHEWAVAARSWRERHGRSGGEEGIDSDVLDESQRNVGATIMGRRMFSGGAGGWDDDPRANGWWGDEPPFHHPVFVLTHHPREPLALQGTTFTFVTEGIEPALEQARAAAGDKDVAIGGGASVVQQYLQAGVVDEFQVHVVPVFLGAGVRLFDGLAGVAVEADRVVAAPAVTHLRYRVAG